ncbi:hypothetical protein OH458_17540 [Vibrio sp. MarTm2]|uniref:hypothetical protein n=1 Tax=Vibrio sp. MarTm2 TaxID=2998831 RepID=UPI0022CDB4D4|nr:hypothetical protein [Vibrio sp. MarTm2]MDA0129878.1 hypothetical protein [Vibrio sp. MarTm2]
MYKLARSISSKGCYEITHFYWSRSKGDNNEDFLGGINKVCGLDIGGGKVTIRLLYFVWMFRVFLYACSLPRESKIWALGFESAFPCVVASILKKHDVIYDDADRFSMLFPFFKPIRKLLEALEVYTSNRSLIHVVPTLDRYCSKFNNLFLLPNVPSEYELNESVRLSEDLVKYSSKTVIYYNGWIGRSRGLDNLLRLRRELTISDLFIVVAGRLDGDAADEFSKMNGVKYVGEISQKECLSYYYISNYIYTYYDPSLEINRFAMSNKWGDAFFTNTPIIVNSEVKYSNVIVDNGLGISFKYSDYDSLKEFILSGNLDSGNHMSEKEPLWHTYDCYVSDLLNRI